MLTRLSVPVGIMYQPWPSAIATDRSHLVVLFLFPGHSSTWQIFIFNFNRCLNFDRCFRVCEPVEAEWSIKGCFSEKA
jgi:hypothetical protein